MSDCEVSMIITDGSRAPAEEIANHDPRPGTQSREGICPDCGAVLIRLGTCFSCPLCGYGGCG